MAAATTKKGRAAVVESKKIWRRTMTERSGRGGGVLIVGVLRDGLNRGLRAPQWWRCKGV